MIVKVLNLQWNCIIEVVPTDEWVHNSIFWSSDLDWKLYHCEMGLMITYEHSVRLCVTYFFQRLRWTMMKNSCLAGLRNWTAADTKFTTEKSIQLVRYPASI